MAQSLVNIIIPFYNEENYLSRAVESAINQSYSKIEIILINDGSTDNSKAIAEKFCKKYSNIHLINSSNESLGAARNKGVSIAKGEYITFLDADDELDADMVKICLTEMVEDQYDLVIAKFKLLDEIGNLLKVSGWIDMPKTISSLECIKAIYSNKVVPTAWGKLYRTETVKKIQFPERIWFEDNPFLLEYLLKTNRVCFMDRSVMNIHSRKDSITRRTITEKRIIDLNKAFFLQLDLVNKYVSNLILKQNIVELIFRNQNRAMLDTFILCDLDIRKLDKIEQSKIRKLFLEVLEKVKTKANSMAIKLPVKNQFLFILLISPNRIGWRIPVFVLRILKYKKYKFLKKLKG
jgi:glycosyltransferase involved in cell wall biosynthesis